MYAGAGNGQQMLFCSIETNKQKPSALTGKKNILAYIRDNNIEIPQEKILKTFLDIFKLLDV